MTRVLKLCFVTRKVRYGRVSTSECLPLQCVFGKNSLIAATPVYCKDIEVLNNDRKYRGSLLDMDIYQRL